RGCAAAREPELDVVPRRERLRIPHDRAGLRAHERVSTLEHPFGRQVLEMPVQRLDASGRRMPAPGVAHAIREMRQMLELVARAIAGMHQPAGEVVDLLHAVLEAAM